MKLTILVPSESYKSSAGARIRYRRLTSCLREKGVELSLEEVRTFDPRSTDCDVLLISKCYDGRALVAAAEMFRRRKLVGVDMFDDYFSAPADSRLLRQTGWLTQILRFCDFAVCSTQKMAEVAAQYDGDVPVHTLNDPAPPVDFDAIGSAVTKKFAQAQADGVFRIGWFGVGDNPLFTVGLADLSAHAAMLQDIARSGMPVELTILTNRRSLTTDGLSTIEQLPVPHRVLEWSETAERMLLDYMMAIFLPVSAQPFSIAKSLNRAVSALSSGCQVLSAGYPLYSSLDPFIYRSAEEFVDDFGRGSLRLSEETSSQYRRVIERVASPANEAARLARFLFELNPRPGRRSIALALIHGHSTHPDAHRMIQDVNGFSVASPYCTAPLDFDVIFRGGAGGLRMFVSRNAAERLLPGMRPNLKRIETDAPKGYLRLTHQGEPPAAKNMAVVDWEKAEVACQLATYESAMVQIKKLMTDAFGVPRSLISERSSLPFPALPE